MNNSAHLLRGRLRVSGLSFAVTVSRRRVWRGLAGRRRPLDNCLARPIAGADRTQIVADQRTAQYFGGFRVAFLDKRGNDGDRLEVDPLAANS